MIFLFGTNCHRSGQVGLPLHIHELLADLHRKPWLRLVDPGTVFLFKAASTMIVATVQCTFAGKAGPVRLDRSGAKDRSNTSRRTTFQ